MWVEIEVLSLIHIIFLQLKNNRKQKWKRNYNFFLLLLEARFENAIEYFL